MCTTCFSMFYIRKHGSGFSARLITGVLHCRRYIQAATSPKDIIIVVDISGSMKGLKLTIAKHTINTILDTLGENDFVNIIAVGRRHPSQSSLHGMTFDHYTVIIYVLFILQYTDYVQYVEPCFKGTLVQADLDNREVCLSNVAVSVRVPGWLLAGRAKCSLAGLLLRACNDITALHLFRSS